MNGVGQLQIDIVVQVGPQEGQRFLEIEAQVRDVDFAQLGHRTQPTEFQIGLNTGGQHHMELRGSTVHQRLH
ncbi:hypothetical protein D9M71_462140 [compost metagenome]